MKVRYSARAIAPWATCAFACLALATACSVGVIEDTPATPDDGARGNDPRGVGPTATADAAPAGRDASGPADARAREDAPAAPPSCATAAPPTAGLALWLQAGEGIVSDGAGNVSSWSDRSGGAAAVSPSGHPPPTLVRSAIHGRDALHFQGGAADSDQAALERKLPIDGLTGLTIAFVNATDVLWKDDPGEWCHFQGCDADPSTKQPGVREISETGCSGTYQHVLWWDGAPDPSRPGSAYDWSGVFLSPKQEGIGFRFGNKVETYSQSCCDIAHDENVEWHRPTSIGARWTETIAVHDGLVNTLYVDGAKAHTLPVPGGKDPAVYANDTLDIGNGFGWVDSHNHGGLVAEVMVYTRALAPAEITAVDAYLACALFPERAGAAAER